MTFLRFLFNAVVGAWSRVTGRTSAVPRCAGHRLPPLDTSTWPRGPRRIPRGDVDMADDDQAPYGRGTGLQ
jgi:hypothetical protein